MEAKDFFRELFAYTRLANHNLFEALQGAVDADKKVLSLSSHILNAHHIWNSRLSGNTPGFTIWQVHGVSSFKEVNEDNYRGTLRLIDTMKPEHAVSYTNSRGQSFSNSVADILFHIVNHSTHHRAQIASSIRTAGAEPPVGDYIFYRR
jgi:uncharacterized damage-inducible protein DinB